MARPVPPMSPPSDVTALRSVAVEQPGRLLYTAYQASEDLLAPSRALASYLALGADLVPAGWQGLWTRHVGATAKLATLTRVRHERPDWAIDRVVVDGAEVVVEEQVADMTPFCTLRRFAKAGVPAGPPVLVVAPLAGHFATLLRETVQSLLADHDVYVTDWHNIRDVPLDEGDFDLDDAIEHLMRFIRVLGAGCHVLAVCQPCPSALVAVAVMAEMGDEAVPATLTLMAGPVDGRVNPTAVNQLAVSRPLDWFEQNVITVVPSRFAGRGRHVYPGFLQLGGFLSMKPHLHLKRHLDAYVDLVSGDGVTAGVVEAFYAEYYAMLDLSAPFYLETVDKVFQRYDLARGKRTWRGNRVDVGAIRETALLTVEAGRDDVCGPGQTAAAHKLCRGIPSDRREAYIEPEVGHYGVFSGFRWRTSIYPIVRAFVAKHDRPRTA